MEKPLFLTVVAACLMLSSARAATWEYRYSGPQPRVEIAPLRYGKTWAYTIEIDDGPASTLEVSQSFLAKYQWNDAPPGIKGGADRSFIGTAAVSFGSVDTGNPTYLDLKQLGELKMAGWSIVNHSYWHSGNHWEPSQFLKPEDFRRELFWSQLFYAQDVGDGRAATHFVYPNGDFHYQDYLKEFSLRSASRVSGSSPRNLFDVRWNPLDLDRNYLDQEPWAAQNDALTGLPQPPKAGDFIIDFTHGMNGDMASANYKLWTTRLDYLAQFGTRGDNSMWVAPTDEIVNYHLAAQAAKVNVAPGVITVILPDDAPASALTLKISGLGEQTQLLAPAETTLYRQGTTAWLTTPIIGQKGVELAAPRLEKIYSGPVKDLSWDKPVKIAGVRLLQSGSLTANYAFKLQIETPDGATESLAPDGTKLSDAWGIWRLFPTIPDRAAMAARALKIAPDSNLRRMEVWVLAQ